LILKSDFTGRKRRALEFRVLGDFERSVHHETSVHFSSGFSAPQHNFAINPKLTLSATSDGASGMVRCQDCQSSKCKKVPVLASKRNANGCFVNSVSIFPTFVAKTGA
jgi:hypothetical protein